MTRITGAHAPEKCPAGLDYSLFRGEAARGSEPPWRVTTPVTVARKRHRMRRTSRGWAVAAALAASTALAVTPAVSAVAGTASSPTKADAKAAAAKTAKDRNIPVGAP